MSGLLQGAVTRQAELRPDAPAVLLGGDRLTYGRWNGPATGWRGC